MARSSEIIAWLDQTLQVRDWPDYDRALNGLQISGKTEIQRVGYAVDACQDTLHRAVDQNVDLLLVHHGLFWGGLQPLTGVFGDSVRVALEAGLGLYSAHLPLDGHPDFGNAVQIGRKLGLKSMAAYGDFRGYATGVRGQFAGSFAELCGTMQTVIAGTRPLEYVPPNGLEREGALDVAVVTGSAGDEWATALSSGCNCLITGEFSHHQGVAARDAGFGLVAAGHYETEIVGVQALAEEIGRLFKLDVCGTGTTPWQFQVAN